MLSKQQHIEYWVSTSNEDWGAVHDIISAKRYVHALFFAHLSLEKLLKAYWVKVNSENHPPKTHNLVRLAALSSLELTEEMLVFLDKFNDFQLEGRYPDYWNMIYKTVDKQFTSELISQLTPIRQWLLEKLQ